MGAVETRGARVDRVDHHEAPARRTRGSDDRGQRVYQQLGAESLAVQALVKGQLGEENGGDLLGCAAAHTSRELAALDDVGGKGEVADNGTIILLKE